MSEPLGPNSQPSMFSAEDFPVSRTRWLADVPAPTTSAISGPSSRDSFASLDPDGSWRKTCQGYSQVTLDGSLERFSETWPRAGMTRNGIAYRRQPLVPLTDEIASGLLPTPEASNTKVIALRTNGRPPRDFTLPTPTAGDSKNARNSTARRYRIPPTGIHAGDTLTDYVTMWPTPTSRDHKDGTAQSCANVPSNGLLGRVVHEFSPPLPDSGASGSLNPVFVEWLMGYPLEWTVCEAWATRSSRKSRNGSRSASKNRHVFTDGRYRTLALDHKGPHSRLDGPSEILAWPNLEQKQAERWFRRESGALAFQLTGPELMRIRHALEHATSPTPPAVAREEQMLTSIEIAYENERLRAENERLRAELDAARAAVRPLVEDVKRLSKVMNERLQGDE